VTRHKSSGKLLATRSARLIVACALMVAAGNLSRRVSADNGVNPNALAIKEFTDRVKDYISLHKKMESALPPLKPSKDPADIDEHRKALAAGIRKARQTAKPGDIFGSAADLIRGVIKEDAEDRSVRDVDAAMEEVPARNPPAVNAEYPEKASLATIPPLLLLRLPPLPEGVESRFMGRDLILRDPRSTCASRSSRSSSSTA
jgi:hypothetical protein